MSIDRWSRVLQGALDGMGLHSDSLGPQPLIASLLSAFKARGINAAEEDAARLAEALLPEDPNEALARKWGEALRQWDDLPSADWTKATAQHSRERRDLIYTLLQTSEEWNARCEVKHTPRLSRYEAVPVIGDDWQPWYDSARQQARQFFWADYKRYLRETQHWPVESVQNLDRDSTAVVARLSDPESPVPRPVRGLVVGYVQSGKTANFTAVIAKAADAGYRLVIVLAGTLDVLRNQTQRRLDKELIGRELIEHRLNDDGGHDYLEDSEWDEFVRHGGLPQDIGGFDWQRLTTATFDYQSLKAGIRALEFAQSIPGRPYNDPNNLHRDTARLLVIKKSPQILKKVIHDLKRLRTALSTVPTLIIDDESDLASVNTLPPKRDRKEEKRRTATNSRINELLALLPRAAYVGYTATPAATVLMDSEDELFPRDFIIPLPKPAAYMGVSEFVDLDHSPESSRYRERAYIRKVHGDDGDEPNLPRAVDCYVLAGCIKIHREQKHGARFKHHTMLVHRSHLVSEHSRDRDLVLGIFSPERYLTPEAAARLGRLLVDDFAEIRILLDAKRGPADSETLPHASALPDLLRIFFEERLHRDGVIVVNGDANNDVNAPDFDKGPLWAILVGGTKLSRGYTVEGLTTSYYRRSTASSDTLMQMGRWFGYRPHYSDLVRVFLGTEERKNKPPLDLYEEFRACCIDEEEFRAELMKYALASDRPLRPRDVPPLVYRSGLLPPTAKNKMRHARQAVSNFGGAHKEPTLAASKASDIASNWRALETLCSTGHLERCTLALESYEERPSFPALIGVFSNDAVRSFLKDYKWLRDGAFKDVLEYIEGTKGDPEIRDWCVLFPQLIRPGNAGSHTFGSITTDIHERARIEATGRYKVFSSPNHVTIAKAIAGLLPDLKDLGSLRRWHATGRAVLSLYAIKAPHECHAGPCFFSVFPKNNLPWKVTFVTDAADAE